MSELSIDLLRSKIEYDPTTGLFKRDETKFGRSAGWWTGAIHKNGGYVFKILGKSIYAHRLAWALFYGKWPNTDIDHINGVRTDNRMGNLRMVSHRVNGQNMKVHRNGNLPGATKRGKYGWSSSIKIKGKQYYIGTFKTEMMAHEMYMSCCNSEDPINFISDMRKRKP